MPTLRQIVDGRTLLAQSPVAKKPSADPLDTSRPPGKSSPAGDHVATHIQDPYGATKDQLDELNQAKMDYELKKQNAVMKLRPVEQVVQGIKNMHRLDTPDGSAPALGTGMENPDLAQAGNFGPQTPQDGTGGQIDPATGNPYNMSQTPGQMNMTRPSQAGFQPGVSPGPAESVRPAKMGVPQPGQGSPAGRAAMPSGWGNTGSNPQGNTFNPSAPKPAGAQQLPGAKGPGDPKVQNAVKKAQGGGGGNNGKSGGNRPIKIQVHADSKTPSGAPTPLSAAMGVANLRSCNTKMKSSGTSEGASKGWDSRGRGRKGEYKTEPPSGYGEDTTEEPAKSAPARSGGAKARPYVDSDHGINSPANREFRKFGEGTKSREPWGYIESAKRKMTGGVFIPKAKARRR